MTTNHHTAISTGAAANASTFNNPLGQLDTAITTNATSITANAALAATTTAEVVSARAAYSSLGNRLDALVLAGGNVATLTNGAASAGQKVVTVDSTTGFLAGAPVAYTLAGSGTETNTIDTVDSPTQLTMDTNIGTGGIPDNTFLIVVPPGVVLAAGIAGGQTIHGGSAANEDLILEGTSSATKTSSAVILQPNGGLVGIGTTPYEDADSVGLLNIVGSYAKILDIRVDNTYQGDVAAGVYLSMHAQETGGNLYVGYGIDDADGLSIGHSWHAGVKNTGSDEFTIYHTGNEFVITLDGDVGIGTATPVARTEILNSDAGTAFSSTYHELRLINTDQTPNNWSGILFADAAASGFDGGIGMQWLSHTGGSEQTDIVFFTRNAGAFAERARVSNLGHFGVGIAAPAYRLDAVEANNLGSGAHYVARFTNVDANAGIVAGWYANGAANTAGFVRSLGSLPLYFGTTGANTALNILNTGLVGVGTTSPTEQLHIFQPSATGGIAPLRLEQADDDKQFIVFDGNAGTGNCIEVVGAKTLTVTHYIKVYIADVGERYLALGTIA